MLLKGEPHDSDAHSSCPALPPWPSAHPASAELVQSGLMALAVYRWYLSNSVHVLGLVWKELQVFSLRVYVKSSPSFLQEV